MATRNRRNNKSKKESNRPGETRGTMSVSEAGHKGGQRERELVEKGHERESDEERRR